MPRRSAAAVRQIDNDSVHGSRLVQQVINKVMIDGKKSLAERIVYDALETLSRRTGQPPVEALETSIKALTPALEVRSRRVGGATYQVPVEVPQRRARTVAVRWLGQFSPARREKTMAERLAGELSDAQNEQGGAFKRKEDIYRMAPRRGAGAPPTPRTPPGRRAGRCRPTSPPLRTARPSSRARMWARRSAEIGTSSPAARPTT